MRPSMHLVAVKNVATQSRAVASRTHQCVVRQCTQLINALRGHLAAFGVLAPKGPVNLSFLESVLADNASNLSATVCDMRGIHLNQIARLSEVIIRQAASKTDTELRRLCSIPGIGPVTVSAVAAFAPGLGTLESGRDFAAWLGLVPRQRSTGGKTKWLCLR